MKKGLWIWSMIALGAGMACTPVGQESTSPGQRGSLSSMEKNRLFQELRGRGTGAPASVAGRSLNPWQMKVDSSRGLTVGLVRSHASSQKCENPTTGPLVAGCVETQVPYLNPKSWMDVQVMVTTTYNGDQAYREKTRFYANECTVTPYGDPKTSGVDQPFSIYRCAGSIYRSYNTTYARKYCPQSGDMSMLLESFESNTSFQTVLGYCLNENSSGTTDNQICTYTVGDASEFWISYAGMKDQRPESLTISCPAYNSGGAPIMEGDKQKQLSGTVSFELTEDTPTRLPYYAYADEDRDQVGGGSPSFLGTFSQIPLMDRSSLQAMVDGAILDCDDAIASVHPGASELCNGLDDDCDGLEDEDLKPCPIDASDADLDGVEAEKDCDDGNPERYPGASEQCNGWDDDCDVAEDEELPTTVYYWDHDGDGYGNPEVKRNLCAAQPGWVKDNTDCDDARLNTYPGASERCDGFDNNCDGEIEDPGTSYVDKDNAKIFCGSEDKDMDGYPFGQYLDDVWSVYDCDDLNDDRYPGATEITGDGIDQDCDGQEVCYLDRDDDGYLPDVASTVNSDDPDCIDVGEAYSTNPIDDCDDDQASVNPGAQEICDGIDNNCNGYSDDADNDVTEQPSWYTDADKDGYGSAASFTISCTQPSGYVPNNTDCNDTNNTISPAAQEVCDGIDNDCDALIDDADSSISGQTTWYKDMDRDGYGGSAGITPTVKSCTKPSGYVLSNTDCNDANKAINPAADEQVATGIDENCDGKELCYADSDKDGYGTTTTVPENTADADLTCETAEGEATNSTDCDDASNTDYPGATETVANGDDDNCDRLELCYQDSDKDGYGTSTTVTENTADADLTCETAEGEATNTTDCDDLSSGDRPGATETVANGDDDNCDGKELCYQDSDKDGYGTSTTVTENAADTDLTCETAEGEATNTTDCDDLSSSDRPGATETVANGDDDNCDGKELCYVNTDKDGYGTSTTVTENTADADLTCETAEGEATNTTDCDDASNTDYPGASETVGNGDDDNCDGKELCYVNSDKDGYGTSTTVTENSGDTDLNCETAESEATISGDCNDGSAVTFPGAAQKESSSSCRTDSDDDGYGSKTPVTGAIAGGDCNDAVSSIYPSAAETCNGVDDNCNGTVDDGVITTYYQDNDADGYGSTTATTACSKPTGYATVGGDCNDTSSVTFPGAAKQESTTSCRTDADKDGYGSKTPVTGAIAGGDCNDGVSSIFPNAAETCNGADDDCYGGVDDGVSIKEMASGDSHVLVRCSDGKVYSIGNGNGGRLGTGNSSNRNTPALVSTLSDVTKIATADATSMAITTSGKLFEWGMSVEGYNCSSGSPGRWEYTPKEVTSLSGKVVTDVAGAWSSAIALVNGQLYVAGAFACYYSSPSDSKYGKATFVAVTGATGYQSIYADPQGGGVLARKSSGQLDYWREDMVKSIVTYSSSEMYAVMYGSPLLWQSGTSPGTVYGIGDNTYTQLAYCGSSPSAATVLTAFNNTSPVSIATGHQTGIMATDTGDVLTWGGNISGCGTLLMSGSGIEEAIIISVAIGDRQEAGQSYGFYAADASGRMWSWGCNYYGQLGNGAASTYCTDTAVRVSNMGPP